MTTIAAKNYGHKIILGADSQVTTNKHYIQIYQEKILKFKVGSDYLYLCCSGEANTITWLRHFLNTASWNNDTLNGSTFTQIQVILIKAFKFIKENLKDSGLEIDIDFYAIMIFQGKLIYYSAGNYQEISEGQHIAFGTGSHFALGAMDAGASVKRAIQIACKRDIYSGGEIDVIDFDVDGSPCGYIGTREIEDEAEEEPKVFSMPDVTIRLLKENEKPNDEDFMLERVE